MTWRHDLVGVSMMSMLALLVATGCGAEDGHTRVATERLAGDFAEGGAPISPADAATPGTSGKILYLANPYGFSAQQRAGPLQELVVALESLGAQVWGAVRPQRRDQPDEPELRLPDRSGEPSRRTRHGWALPGRQRLSPRRGRDGGGGHGDRVGEAGIPLPRRLPTLHRQRGLSAQADVVHRPSGDWLGSQLVYLGPGAGPIRRRRSPSG